MLCHADMPFNVPIVGNNHKLYAKNIFTDESKISLACAPVRLLHFSEGKEREQNSHHILTL